MKELKMGKVKFIELSPNHIYVGKYQMKNGCYRIFVKFNAKNIREALAYTIYKSINLYGYKYIDKIDLINLVFVGYATFARTNKHYKIERKNHATQYVSDKCINKIFDTYKLDDYYSILFYVELLFKEVCNV